MHLQINKKRPNNWTHKFPHVASLFFVPQTTHLGNAKGRKAKVKRSTVTVISYMQIKTVMRHTIFNLYKIQMQLGKPILLFVQSDNPFHEGRWPRTNLCIRLVKCQVLQSYSLGAIYPWALCSIKAEAGLGVKVEKQKETQCAQLTHGLKVLCQILRAFPLLPWAEWRASRLKDTFHTSCHWSISKHECAMMLALES
jgi:hypothetical protein